MYAAIKNGIIVAVVQGVIDPVQTRLNTEPLAVGSPEYKDFQIKQAAMMEAQRKVNELIRQGRQLQGSPVLRRMPRIQRKLLDPIDERYLAAKEQLQLAKEASATAGDAYNEKRRELYTEHAVYLAPGGCIPLTDELKSQLEGLEPGQYLTAEGQVIDGTGQMVTS